MTTVEKGPKPEASQEKLLAELQGLLANLSQTEIKKLKRGIDGIFNEIAKQMSPEVAKIRWEGVEARLGVSGLKLPSENLAELTRMLGGKSPDEDYFRDCSVFMSHLEKALDTGKISKEQAQSFVDDIGIIQLQVLDRELERAQNG